MPHQALASIFTPFLWGAIFVLLIIAFALIARTSKVAKGIGYAIGIIPVFLIALSLLGFAFSRYMQWSAERDFAYFEELCKAQAGDKIYKTVEGVEGIFQMRPRESEEAHFKRTGLEAKADQYGMEDPFSLSIGDSKYLYEMLLKPLSPEKRGRFLFFEMPLAVNPGDQPLYRQLYLSKTGKMTKVLTGEEVEELAILEKTVPSIQSRYGYSRSDISTPPMRDKWIAGGKLTIVDLRTNEVLAERTGFIFARHRDGSRDKYPWGGSPLSSICPRSGDPNYLQASQFILSVLKPAN
jgi:hypothetical protein